MSKITYKYLNKSLNLFDVSLRDGLQTWKRIPSLNEKKSLLHKISKLPNVNKIEVGSVVSHKILPQFNDSIELYHYTRKTYNHLTPYLLVPNLKMQEKALFSKIENMSFITSISDQFQKKNTNMNLDETKTQIKKMIDLTPGYTKLYISCINECPIDGIIDNNTIIKEVIDYMKLPLNEICISDTCGTLTEERLSEILTILLYLMQIHGIPIQKLSIHLHKHKNMNETKKIIHYCLSKYIYNFDVSYLDSGGCSVTMNNTKMNNNLQYDDLYFLK